MPLRRVENQLRIVRDPAILIEEKAWVRWSAVYGTGQDNEPGPIANLPISLQILPISLQISEDVHWRGRSEIV
jgi:hypothetical protein